jgi:hypothetical protein
MNVRMAACTSWWVIIREEDLLKNEYLGFIVDTIQCDPSIFE